MKNTVIDTPLLSKLKKEFTDNSQAHDPSMFSAIRKEAFQKFGETGFPSTKNEEWKYTNLSALLKEDFSLSTGSVSKEEVQKQFYVLEANHIVIVNGKYSKEFSKISSAAIELSISEIKDADKAIVEKYFARATYSSKDGLSLLNTAFAASGVCIEVKKNKVLQVPIFIYYINDCRKENCLTQPRTLIIAEENAQAAIVESYITFGEHTDFTNALSELVLKQDAHIDYYKIQYGSKNSYHIGSTEVLHEAKSTSSSTTITLGGVLTRNNLNISLNAEHCEAYLNGLYLVNGNQHVDNHTVADHAMPNCYSNELYKGIMDDQSSGVFNGKIMVKLDAQKTNAFQSNKNILLSKDASINTKPQLEIFADDVKCSHGATTGQLDHEALFYLRSRGIGALEAQRFLLHAFANDVLERIKIEPLKAVLISKLEDRLQ